MGLQYWFSSNQKQAGAQLLLLDISAIPVRSAQSRETAPPENTKTASSAKIEVHKMMSYPSWGVRLCYYVLVSMEFFWSLPMLSNFFFLTHSPNNVSMWLCGRRRPPQWTSTTPWLLMWCLMNLQLTYRALELPTQNRSWPVSAIYQERFNVVFQ